jgi:DNA-cytosine methyltransferase
MRIRKLTPVECERLQGYKDNHTKFGRTEDGKVVELSDTQRYKLCGNGISAPVSKHILETLLPEGNFKLMSTFSGTGGTELLLDKRFEVIGHSEFDKYASMNLHYNYPHIKNFGDITKLDVLPEHDILAGGFPCTTWSIAGLRAGFDDKRGQLIYDVFRLIRTNVPKYVILENVKNLISHGNGESIKAIFEGISNLGYTIDFNLVNSKNFGLAQNRERIFIFCMRNDCLLPEKKTTNLVKCADKLAKFCMNSPNINYRQVGIPSGNGMPPAIISDILEDDVAEKYYIKHEIVERILKEHNFQDRLAFKTDKNGDRIGRDVSYALDANSHKGTNTTEKSRRQLVAYSKSTRKDHIDHRIKDTEANTLSTGDGCSNMSSMNLVREE